MNEVNTAVKKNALIEALYQIAVIYEARGIQYSNHDMYLSFSYYTETCPKLLPQLMEVIMLTNCELKIESNYGTIKISIQLK